MTKYRNLWWKLSISLIFKNQMVNQIGLKFTKVKQISMYKIPPLQIMPPSSPPPFFTIRGQNPLSNYEVLKEMEVNATGNIREATGR